METLRMKLTGKYVQWPINEELRKSVEEGPPANEANSKASSFSGLQTYNPIFDYIWRSHSNQAGQWFENEWRISKFDGDKSIVEKSANPSQKKSVNCFRKAVHLLDPIAILNNQYTFPKTPGLPWHTYSTYAAINKVQSPHNQAYIDALGSYLCSRLREENISPHFALHYGSLVSMSDKYLYNITDDYDTYKNEKWFWNGIKSKELKIHVLDNSGVPIEDEVLLNELINRHMMKFSTGISGEQINEVNEETIELSVEVGSMDAIEDFEIPMCKIEDESIPKNNNRKGKKDEEDEDEDEDGDEEEDEDDEDDEEEDDGINIYIEFNRMPIIMSFYERQDGSMDDLLYDDEEVGATCGSKQWEERWTAWMFQIIIALSQMQSIYNMTHNDLHTNNVLWSRTDREFIYYKSSTGQFYKIPTYGKIFRIIDFGRAIYDVNKKTMISDDYLPGNDAGDMYNFGYIEDPEMPEVQPNTSFDLARLAVSCLEGIFPKFPGKRKDKPKIMSKEEGRTMWETTSPLFNLLWSWLLTDDGENILLDEENNERYPSFELYIVIAESVHGAVPKEQINKPLFQKFKWNKNIPASAVIYNIY